MLKPMLASLADAPLTDPGLVYEPKYDGIRAIAEVPAGAAARGGVHLWSRLGNEKTLQFPEVADALALWARRRKEPVVLDGEVVALDTDGQPTGFQQLQGRIHLSDVEPLSRTPSAGPARATKPGRPSIAYIVFDVLRIGRRDLRDRPLAERRAALEGLFADAVSPILRISDQVRGDARKLYALALERGWEGLIAKQADSVYKSGKRTPDWRKLKIVQEQEFVVGGWTEPRQSRQYFGALLLGVYEDDRLLYAGHTGTGFNEKELARVMKLLKPLETDSSPFTPRPRTNERPHWVEPKLVAQIKFTEWTSDNKLRHPVYLGLRDDKKAEEVRRETKSRLTGSTTVRLQPEPNDGASKKRDTAGSDRHRASRSRTAGRVKIGDDADTAFVDTLVDQLRTLEDSRRDGVLELPDGVTVSVTNLHKVFWPKQKFTKGDLFRYYAEVSPWLLPALADRPLVMKRYPNGVAAKPFYQHRAEKAPEGIRVEMVTVAERRPHIIGGSLGALMYTTQLAAISQDPWFSRIQTPLFADHVALDLDPPDDAPFSRVLEVARWIHDELESLGVEGVPKTSGSAGLHIYIPLPPGTPYDAGLLFCQIVATVVTHKHPKQATTERAIAARGRRVYVDCMQNALGKTLASAYSARASDYAGVSTPLTWQEVHDGVDREDFTIKTVPARVKAVGDLWARLRESKGADLSTVAKYQR